MYVEIDKVIVDLQKKNDMKKTEQQVMQDKMKKIDDLNLKIKKLLPTSYIGKWASSPGAHGSTNTLNGTGGFGKDEQGVGVSTAESERNE